MVLRELLALNAEGTEPDSCLWFWYHSDSSRKNPHDTYSFFVASDDKIVRENISFDDYLDSGFDPTIFEANDDINDEFFTRTPPGLNTPSWREARTKFWYLKFYAETRTGQLMVLGPDKPLLYDHARARLGDTARELALVTLGKAYGLLLVALPLFVVLAFA